MDATAYRPEEAESGEPVNHVSAASKAGDIGSSTWTFAASMPRVCVSAEEGYERWAPTYDHAPNPLLHLEERKLAALLPNLSGKCVLDLACGTGRWLQKLVSESGSTVGVDFSAAMLRVAGRKTAIRGRLARADCQRLPFHGSVFDLVLCSFALGHIPDVGSIVRELSGVTKAGADVFVSDLHPEAYALGWRTGFRDSGGAIQIKMSPHTSEEIVRAFYVGGFECLTHVPLCFGEPERPIFAQAGKEDLFEAACRMPAVLLCHFTRTIEKTEYRSGVSIDPDVVRP